MNRRDFIAASGLAGAASLSGLGMPASGQHQDAAQEYYELRQYHLLYGPKQQRVHAFLRDAAIPAMRRMGIGPVGAFQVMYGSNQPSLFLLLPHPSLESVVTLTQRLLDDDEFRRAGADFLDVPLSDPAYVRVESSLMRAFSEMPKLEVPAAAAEGGRRLFELRTYESHSEIAARKKVQMFNEGGEIPIFRRTGLQPVFFGEGIIGPKLPNLTYMLVFEDLAARDRAWDAFRVDPDWKTLSADPYYADTVSTISDIILRPTPYSQV